MISFITFLLFIQCVIITFPCYNYLQFVDVNKSDGIIFTYTESFKLTCVVQQNSPKILPSHIILLKNHGLSVNQGCLGPVMEFSLLFKHNLCNILILEWARPSALVLESDK